MTEKTIIAEIGEWKMLFWPASHTPQGHIKSSVHLIKNTWNPKNKAMEERKIPMGYKDLVILTELLREAKDKKEKWRFK